MSSNAPTTTSADNTPVAGMVPPVGLPAVCLPEHEAVGRQQGDDRIVSVCGVEIADITQRRAVEILVGLLDRRDGRSHSVFFINAHTLNLSASDEHYRAVLRSADWALGDGTGVRWAARLWGIRLRDNLVGTDLVPTLFEATQDRGYRYFLLGADEDSIARAAQYAAGRFPGWVQAGYHHGYLKTAEENARAVQRIHEAKPDLLLVGQGNPIQEYWTHNHKQALQVPVCMAVGGLFDYWAGNLRRSPLWLRRNGFEWLGILLQQPRKASRYFVGNPLFLARVLRDRFLARPKPR